MALLREVTCHHLASMDDERASNVSVGVAGDRPASEKVRTLLAIALSMASHVNNSQSVQVSTGSRFSALAICKKNDVVLIKDGDSFCAGKVKLHADILSVPVSMIAKWYLHSIDRDAGWADWRTEDNDHLIQTEDIFDVVCYTKMRDNIVRTILPAEFH